MSDIEAAAHMLRHPSIKDRMEPFVRYPLTSQETGPIDWQGIITAADGMFSDGELVIVNAAFSLWSGQSTPLVGDERHSPSLPHLLGWLDEPSLLRLSQAIALKRGSEQQLLAGKMFVGRRLNGPGTGIAWVVLPEGRAEELTIHTPSGSALPKSPDGHEWGYNGSGPAQLSLDVLWETTGREPHPMAYQRFKEQVLSPIAGDSFAFSEAFVAAWLEQFDGERFA